MKNAMLGARIRELRKNMGLSQEDFAAKIEITRVHLGYIERGESGASKKVISKLTELSGKSQDWFFGSDAQPHSEPRDPELHALTSEVEAKLPDKVPVLKGIMRGMLAMLSLIYILIALENAASAGMIGVQNSASSLHSLSTLMNNFIKWLTDFFSKDSIIRSFQKSRKNVSKISAYCEFCTI